MIDLLFKLLSPLLYDAGRLTVWLVLLAVIFVPLEQLFPLHPSRIWRKQFGVDLAWYFINSIFPAILISLPLAILAQILHRLNPGGFYTAMALLPLWVKLALMLFLNDFGAYWGHRALHAYPFLWRFHSIHHSAEHVDWLVNTRAHPVDIVFMRLAGIAPIYLFGLANVAGKGLDPTVAKMVIIVIIWNFFIHANIRLRLGPLEWLISTPVFHHWHHSIDAHRESNYAFFFPFIDRLFGTAWLPKEWPPGYGIREKISATLGGQFFDPFEPRPVRSKPREDDPDASSKKQETESNPGNQ